MKLLPTSLRGFESSGIPIAILMPSTGGENLTREMIGEINPEWKKAGSQHLISTKDKPVLIFGLGESPSLETYRKAVHNVLSTCQTWKIKEIAIMTGPTPPEVQVAMAEAAVLSTYRFSRHLSKPTPHAVETVHCLGMDNANLEKGRKIAEVTCEARDLVNEPANVLTATRLAKETERLGQKYGFSVEIFGKAKIQSLKMGGLLAVNAGSVEPPTFTILEYKPERPVNKQPVVLVGKGVVYDTGGLSLKPTSNSMDFMKCDMAGAAAVIGAICGAAALQLDVHVIGLVPATDNRPGGNAFAPGDIITMYDGTTVEMMNSDAEGRMILADALSYAKQYDPALVIDLATLTGAQVVAIGSPGMALMATADDDVVDDMLIAGEQTYERMVRLPLWQEYRDMLKSEIADLKNLGPSQGGAISAGKFLEHFTDYPWVHLDIAGPAWNAQPDSYRGQGGTGVGVRMLVNFLEEMKG